MTKLDSIFNRLGGRFQRRRAEAAADDDANAALWERSRVRWRQSGPEFHLTWGREVSGDAFVLKMQQYEAFGPGKSLLEIGPGYARLLKTIKQQGVPFADYLGVDISARNVAYLNETFGDAKTSFQQGDVEQIKFSRTFDAAFSSLVFKHLFPSFAEVLKNVAGALNPGGLVFFDLMEGTAQDFEHDGVTFLRHYTRPQVLEILEHCGLSLTAWDEVCHTPEHQRLLVVATKPGKR